MTEGRGTGLPIIHGSMEENGSPPPVFETNENNAYFLCILSIHPLTETILGSQNKSKGDYDNTKIINDLKEIDAYLSLYDSEFGDRDREVIKESINKSIERILTLCQDPKSKDEIFEELGLYKNTKNHNHHIKPLIEIGWLNLILPNKPTSKNQAYYTTEKGKKLLALISIDSHSGIKRIPVRSSNIAAVGYDAENKILEIEFHHGAVYRYVDVPKEVYEQLMSSPAQGAYFMNEIKSKFEYQKK